MDNTEIALGAKTYTIKPLTIRQLTTVLPIFIEQANKTLPERLMGRVTIIATALARDYPEMTEEAILDTEAPMKHLTEAVRKIGILSGILEEDAGDPNAGEAPAGVTLQ